MKQSNDIKTSLEQFEELLDRVRDTVSYEINGFTEDAITALENAERVLYRVEDHEDVGDILHVIDKVKGYISEALNVLR